MSNTPISDEKSKVWDNAIENSLLKTAYGVVGGSLASFILFSKPVFRGTFVGFAAGTAFGMSYIENKIEFDKYNM